MTRFRRLWLLVLIVAAAGPAGTAAATDIQAALAVDPGVAVPGMTVSVNLTATNTGAAVWTTISATLFLNSGQSLVTLISGPYFGGGASLNPGSSMTMTWTFSVVGTGTVAFTGQAAGVLLSQNVQVTADAVLSIPPPAPPALQILGNVLRPGRTATLVIHGSPPGGSVTLTLYDQSGTPVGRVGDGPVVLDGNGFGSARFDGTVRGTRLSTGVYWIAVNGAAASKAPILVTGR